MFLAAIATVAAERIQSFPAEAVRTGTGIACHGINNKILVFRNNIDIAAMLVQCLITTTEIL
jgi:hypothetical protein